MKSNVLQENCGYYTLASSGLDLLQLHLKDRLQLQTIARSRDCTPYNRKKHFVKFVFAFQVKNKLSILKNAPMWVKVRCILQ
jgi:hypothetical protein